MIGWQAAGFLAMPFQGTKPDVDKLMKLCCRDAYMCTPAQS